MMRGVSWVVLLLVVFGAYKFVSNWRNPFNPTTPTGLSIPAAAVPAMPSASALWVPSCKDKGTCV